MTREYELAKFRQQLRTRPGHRLGIHLNQAATLRLLAEYQAWRHRIGLPSATWNTIQDPEGEGRPGRRPTLRERLTGR